MSLSEQLIKEFVKVTNDFNPQNQDVSLCGTIRDNNGKKCVQLDGSQQITPIINTVDVVKGERVMVLLKNHTAYVTGNLSSPAAKLKDLLNTNENLEVVEGDLGVFKGVITDELVAYEAEITKLTAEVAKIGELETDYLTVREKLEAHEADIDILTADNVTINEKLVAQDAEIKGKLTAQEAEIEDLTTKYLTVEDTLKAKFVEIDEALIHKATIEDLTALQVQIEGKLSVYEADIKYANIDFANVGEAAFEYLFSKSGLIENVVISQGTITGNLAGVTISGDLIEAGTLKADRLILKGTDGLYYELNTNGETVESKQTEYNSLNGSVILAQSVTADKMNVTDLSAFNATIGGLHLYNGYIYSGVKNSVSNTTRGIYMDKDGQWAVGDETNYIKFYKNSSSKYLLDISANSIKFSVNNKNLETYMNDIDNKLNDIGDNILITITSSSGTVFKNSYGSTVLTAHVFKNGIEQTIDSNGVCGTLGIIKWYKGQSSSSISTSKTITIYADDIIDYDKYVAKLEKTE